MTDGAADDTAEQSSGDDLADSPFQKTAEQAPAEQGASVEPTTGMMGRLKNTEPNRPIGQVGDLSGIRENWSRYLLRGVEKFAGADDAWAGVDLLKGAVGATLDLANPQSDSNADAPDGDGEPDDLGGDIEDVDIEGQL